VVKELERACALELFLLARLVCFPGVCYKKGFVLRSCHCLKRS